MGILDDGMRVIGAIDRWKRDKSEKKRDEAWNRYNRQVDIHALDALKVSLTHEMDTIDGLILTSSERRQLLNQRAVTSRGRADYIFRSFTDRTQEAYLRNWMVKNVAMARIGASQRTVDREQTAIASARGVLSAERRRLSQVTGIRLRELDATMNQILAEQAAFDVNLVRRLEVNQLQSESVALEGDMLRATTDARLAAMESKEAQIERDIDNLGVAAGLAKAEIDEGAALASGAAKAGAAARTGVGSFTRTEATRIERERRRASLRLEMDTASRAAGLTAAYDALTADRAGVRGQLQTGLSRLGIRGAQTAAERVGLIGERGVQRARTTARQLAVTGQQVAAREGQRVGEAQFRAQEADLTGRERQAAAQRTLIGAERRQVESEYTTGRAEAERIRSEGRLSHADALAEAAGLGVQAREEQRRGEKLVRERADVQTAKQTADWQRERIDDLPLEGQSRSAVGLVLQVAAELI